jgi:hypothetical protein
MRYVQEKALNFTNPAVKSPMIVDMGSHIELLKVQPLKRIPSGFYNPLYSVYTESTSLAKAELFQDSIIEDDDDKDFIRELKMLMEANEYDEIDDSDSSDNNYGKFDRGYLNMEKYNTGIAQAHHSIEVFLKNRNLFKRKDLGYRHSVLLIGEDGIGKTRFFNHMAAKMVVDHDAIVLIIDESTTLKEFSDKGISELVAVTPGRLKVFLIPSLNHFTNHNRWGADLYPVFRHPALRDDVLFLMATNNPNDVPADLIRNQSTVEMIADCSAKHYADDFKKAWYKHLLGETMPKEWETHPFYSMPLTATVLKELYAVTRFHNFDIDKAWEYIEQKRKLIEERFIDQDEVLKRQFSGR